MSCCNRPTVVATPRWPGRTERGPVLPGQAAPPRLRFTGRFTLSLPLGTRRLLVQPGQVLDALAPADAARLWRTGLFEAADPAAPADGLAPGQDGATAL